MTNWSYYRGIPYFGFYDFILSEIFPEKEGEFSLYRGYLAAVKEIHWACMFPEVAFISDFPQEINRNTDHQLHADGKPSLLYRDTYALHHLNGIPVPKELAETPAKDLSAVAYLKEENVDVRREAFRKIGINKVVDDLKAKSIRKMGDYRLLMVDIGVGTPRPFLKMKNPSLKDTWHIEGVHENCKTIKEALAWRNGLKTYTKPRSLT